MLGSEEDSGGVSSFHYPCFEAQFCLFKKLPCRRPLHSRQAGSWPTLCHRDFCHRSSGTADMHHCIQLFTWVQGSEQQVLCSLSHYSNCLIILFILYFAAVFWFRFQLYPSSLSRCPFCRNVPSYVLPPLDGCYGGN